MLLGRLALVRLTSNPSRDLQRQETRPPHQPRAPSNRQRKGPPLPQAVNSRLTGCSSSRVVKSHVSSGEHPITASGNPPTRRRNERHYPESSSVTEGRMTERHIEELAAATDALNTAPRRRYGALSAALAAALAA